MLCDVSKRTFKIKINVNIVSKQVSLNAGHAMFFQTPAVCDHTPSASRCCICFWTYVKQAHEVFHVNERAVSFEPYQADVSIFFVSIIYCRTWQTSMRHEQEISIEVFTCMDVRVSFHCICEVGNVKAS